MIGTKRKPVELNLTMSFGSWLMNPHRISMSTMSGSQFIFAPMLISPTGQAMTPRKNTYPPVAMRLQCPLELPFHHVLLFVGGAMQLNGKNRLRKEADKRKQPKGLGSPSNSSRRRSKLLKNSWVSYRTPPHSSPPVVVLSPLSFLWFYVSSLEVRPAGCCWSFANLPQILARNTKLDLMVQTTLNRKGSVSPTVTRCLPRHS